MSVLWALLPLAGFAAAANVLPPAAELDADAFDRNEYGAYPVQSFVSSPFNPPYILHKSGTPPDDDGRHIFLSPRGMHVDRPGPMILDQDANVVWVGEGYGLVYSFTTQELDGEPYLTFWSGNDAVGGHGAGVYVMLDRHYQEVRRFTAANGLDGDLHEFHFTGEGTVLLTSYDRKRLDLTPWEGPKDGWIWDSIFQEVDVETGEAVFEWRAHDHIPIDDSYKRVLGDGHEDGPYDYFHMNSIEKDEMGNYLICARYTHSLTYIDGKTGKPIWIMGGKSSNFTDLSDGKASDFMWQHDARWHEDYTHISLFDNRAHMGRITDEPSRGMYIRVDTDAMEVELVQEYFNPAKLQASSQGNMQILPNDHVLLGFGYTPAWTEFDMDGNVLWDVHFGSQFEFETGAAQSYRVLKLPWVGEPIEPPSFMVVEDYGYASWNGATEVRQWALEHSDDGEHFESVSSYQKEGFETAIDLAATGPTLKSFLRVSGLDKSGNTLGSSAPWYIDPPDDSQWDSPSTNPLTDKMDDSAEPNDDIPISTGEKPSRFRLSLLFVFGLWVFSILAGALFKKGGSIFCCGRYFFRRRRSYGGPQLPLPGGGKSF